MKFVRKLFQSLKDGVDFGLKFFAVITALFAVRLLSDQPELALNADVVRVIDAGAVTGSDVPCPSQTDATAPTDPPEIPYEVAVACRFNDRVRAGEGVDTRVISSSSGSRIILTQLLPAPGSDDAIALPNLDASVTAIVRPRSIALRGGVEGTPTPGPRRVRWILQTLDGETEQLPPPEEWPEDPRLEGCDSRLVVLVTRYGPTACLVPLGIPVALGGSSGLPTYALELMKAPEGSGIDADALQSALERIESAFAFEAQLTISNEGKGNANSTQIVSPPGFEPREIEGEGACPGPDSSGNFDFILTAAETCQALYVSAPQSLADTGTPLSFGATASNAHPAAPTAIFLTAIAAIVFVILFVVIDVFKPDEKD